MLQKWLESFCNDLHVTNFLSFTSLKYKIGLIHTLVDRVFKINNTKSGLHKNINKKLLNANFHFLSTSSTKPLHKF